MDKEMKLELFDGRYVSIRPVFDCDYGDGLEVRDADTDEYIGDIWGATMPDTNDEDFDIDRFREQIEAQLDALVW